MIVVTGAAGFIASAVVAALNEQGRSDLVLVDAFDRPMKRRNFENRSCAVRIERSELLSWLNANVAQVEAIIHLGARTDTAEMDEAVFNELNLHYSQAVWQWCTQHQVPLIYASSAATYGGGEHGFNDEGPLHSLQPLNPYGWSKHHFDLWVQQQSAAPPFWAGLKFFNVYGPNEYHKGRMASVMFHAFHQIQSTGALRLFRSHRSDYADGGQMRDFIYVKDAVQVILFLLSKQEKSGIYNLGTGQARTFLDLGRAVFASLGKEPRIEWVDTPADIRDKYQYFTEATMTRLRTAGYEAPFHSLEAGIADYVKHYLLTDAIW